MKSSKSQEESSSKKRKQVPIAAPFSEKEAVAEGKTVARNEERGNGETAQAEKDLQQENNRPESFFRRYWHIGVLFAGAWLIGAFFVCSPLQVPIQLRIIEQFPCFSLRASFPFVFSDPEKVEDARRLALEQVPPVFDLKESKAGRIRSAFRRRIQTLQTLPASTLQDEKLAELKKVFANENAVSIFFRCLDEILDCGLIEPEENYPSLQVEDNDFREVIIFTDEHQISRSYASLLNIEAAYKKLQEDFNSRIDKHNLSLEFFREAELLEATLEYNEEKSRKFCEDTLLNLDLPQEHFKVGDSLIEPSPREKAILAAYIKAGQKQQKLSGTALAPHLSKKTVCQLLLLTFFIVSYVFCLTRIRISPANLNQNLVVSAVCMILHFALTFIAFTLYSIYEWPFACLLCLLPLSLVPSLMANLLGGRVAICTAVVISALVPLQISTGSLQYQLFYYSLFTTLTGVAFFQHAKKRRDFIIGAFAVGFAIMLMQIFFAFEQNTIFAGFIPILPAIVLFSYVNGLLVALFCMTLLPIFETCFGLVTLTTLLELNDSNHPLLHRLRLEAPGTFQHSMTVATIAETAANAIHANALLTRVMALFHDIGKIENPEYFAENMRYGTNPHDQLPPEESCRIIMAHVSDGMALAQKHRLRRSISAAIEQHHGNSLQTYFYEKAKKAAKEKGEKEPDEALFRYPHPPPLQKEIVIVSLADACEAAVRSLSGSQHDHSGLLQNAAELLLPEAKGGEDQERRLKEFLARLQKEQEDGLTPENVERMVNKIIDEKWSDNQFDKADITTSELEAIRQSFLRTFMNMFHFRPQYPQRNEEAGARA